MQKMKIQSLKIFAAGSLRGALIELSQIFLDKFNIEIFLEFGPSGVLRQRIEKGEAIDIFLSADQSHPQKLVDIGKFKEQLCFAQNEVCLYGYFSPEKTIENIINILLNPKLRLGTSTPGDDPGGDYAYKVFKLMDTIIPGVYQSLSLKALNLVGGKNSKQPPKGQHPVLNLFQENKIDLFLGYYTSAIMIQKKLKSISIQPLPEPLLIKTDYTLVKYINPNPFTNQFINIITSKPGKSILLNHGFGIE